MNIVYYLEDAPETLEQSIFLAGPKNIDWRSTAIEVLHGLGYTGTVFVPEFRTSHNYSVIDIYQWELKSMRMADVILYWMEHGMGTIPATASTGEYNWWLNPEKIVFGCPTISKTALYHQFHADRLKIPSCITLQDTCTEALQRVTPGAKRTGGERFVPLLIWRTPHFQQWYAAHMQAGNRLDGANVEMVFRVGKNKDFVFCFVMHVNVYVAAEKRNKLNEFIISRPDVSTVLLYERFHDDNMVVLIKEFRSPVSNADCFIYELPSGSSKVVTEPKQLASDEVFEETGYRIDPSRFVMHAPRQLAATFSTHKAHLFSAELTSAEMDWFQNHEGVMRGNIGDSEQTYIQIGTVQELIKKDLVDWATLGMILSVLNEA